VLLLCTYGHPRLTLTQTYSHLLCLPPPKEHIPANWQPKQRRKNYRGTTTQRSQPSQALLVILRKTVTQVQSGVRWSLHIAQPTEGWKAAERGLPSVVQGVAGEKSRSIQSYYNKKNVSWKRRSLLRIIVSMEIFLGFFKERETATVVH